MAKVTRAGEALVEQLLSDPETRAGFERAKAKLLPFSLSVALVNSEEHQAELDRISAEFRSEILRMEDEWEAEFGEPYPKEIEDWYRWAARVGWSGERIAEGNWTLAELFPIIEGYLLQIRDKARKRAGRPSDPIVAKRRERVKKYSDKRKTQGEIAEILKIDIETVKSDRAFLKLGDKLNSPPRRKRKNG